MTSARQHDPFAAPSSTSGGFPATRLARAGIAEPAVGNLAAWYAERSPEQQAEFRKSINRVSDPAIRERFTPPEEGVLEDALTADQLHDLALAAGVSTSGNKGEVAARIREQQAAQPPEQPAGGLPTAGAEQPAEPADGEDGEQAEVEVSGETVTGTLPAAAAQPPAAAQPAPPEPAGQPAAGQPAAGLPAASPQQRPHRRGGSGKGSE
jgi:hypothetical protein